MKTLTSPIVGNLCRARRNAQSRHNHLGMELCHIELRKAIFKKGSRLSITYQYQGERHIYGLLSSLLRAESTHACHQSVGDLSGGDDRLRSIQT